MSSDLASSVNIKVSDELRGPRRATQAPSAVLSMVGTSERGPVGVPTKVTSFEEFQRKFGGYTANNLATIEPIRGFFQGGGRELWFVRTVHYTTPGNPSTKTSAAGSLVVRTADGSPTAGSVTGTATAPFALANGDTIIVKVDGGGNQTATFNATAASRTGSTGPYDLADGQTLIFKINAGTARTATFTTSNVADIDAVTATEVVNILLAKIAEFDMGGVAELSGGAPRIRSNRLGTGSAVEVTGGTAAATLGFSVGATTGTGDAANAGAVTVAELKTLIEGDTTGCTVSNASGAVKITSDTTGTGSSIQVVSSSTADDELGLDNASHVGTDGTAVDTITFNAEDGSYSDDISVRISDPTSGAATDFNLAFLVSSVVVDSWSNVNLDPTSSRYVSTLVNGNNTLGITATDELAAVASPGNLPATGTFGPFTGGDDGLTSLADADFAGAVTSSGATGLRALDGEDAPTLLAIPARCTAAVQSAMATWCQETRSREVFAILDPPAGLSADQMVTYVEQTASLIGSTEMAVTYWPRIKVATPNEDLYGTDNVVIPPSGDIAAAYARNDSRYQVGGAFAHPAGLNVQLPRALELENDAVMKLTTREKLFPKRINPISRERDASGNLTPFFLDGARVLKENGQFPHVGSARGVQILGKSLRAALAFARHKNNTPELRTTCADVCEAFLRRITDTRLLGSTKYEEAFLVDFGPGMNPNPDNKVNGQVGVATTDPAELVDVTLFKDQRAAAAQQAAA